MRTLFTYGGGIPRYLGLWLVLTPALVVGLRLFRVRWPAVLALVGATLPTLFNHDPPAWLHPNLRWVLTTLTFVGLAAWLVHRFLSRPTATIPVGRDKKRIGGLVLLALAVRIPLAWWDPGISDIATSTEVAARQLTHGRNPYVAPNRPSVIGRYQYPAGTLLVHTPLVALVPRSMAGEQHIGVRATLWLTDAAATALLATAAGPAMGFAYAVSPVLVRDGGLTVANDLVLALFVAGAAIALSRRRRLAAAVLLGLAIAVKPAALVLVPLVLVAAGWRDALVALAIPVALQLPFLLWPTVGLHGVGAIAEPVARGAPMAVLHQSTWWPLFRAAGDHGWVLKTTAAANLLVAAVVSLWAGWRLRKFPEAGLPETAAAFALPLLASFALAPIPHLNYEGWYLTAFTMTAS